jgi:RNase H-fold protein (predicted Holliday junction resolvase)
VSPTRILAIDPGREKCGLAAVDTALGLLQRAVIPRGDLPTLLHDWCERHHPTLILLGSGTGSRDLAALLTDLPVPLQIVPERDTTRRARERYFSENPPRGWRRLLPSTLQTPPVPIDDYAAWVLAEQYLSGPSID